MTDNLILQTVILTTLIILLFIAVVAVTIFITHRYRMQQEIRVKEIALSYEKELRKVEAEVAESVMQHVATEIHDNIGQLLTYVRLHMENKMVDSEEMKQTLTPVHEMLADATAQLRRLSRSLNRDFIHEQPLEDMLGMEIEKLRNTGRYQVHWKSDGTSPPLDKDQEMMTFRIFQEVTNNILKHSDAENIFVSLKGTDQFCLTVTDDGKGFDPASMTKSNGIRNILRRAEIAGLKCDFISSPGKGCTVILEAAAAHSESEQ